MYPTANEACCEASRVAVRQIGFDIGRQGLQDDEIIPLLHRMNRPTLFTLDSDFYNRRLCHGEYCLCYLDVYEEQDADYVRRVLRHREFDAKAKRMGRVIRVSPTKLTVWHIREEHERHFSW